jgi:hypothetical protein
MTATSMTTDIVPASRAFPGNLCAEVRETHTGVVVLIGDKAYKAKKPVVERAGKLADDIAARIVELTCSVPLDEAAARIQKRPASTSDATPQIAVALAEHNGASHAGHPINTGRPLAESIAEAEQICCLAI